MKKNHVRTQFKKCICLKYIEMCDIGSWKNAKCVHNLSLVTLRYYGSYDNQENKK